MNTQLVLPRENLFVPDRFEQLVQQQVNLRSVVVPVNEELAMLNERIREMTASRRGAMIIFRGETGSGKSTFLDTAGLFLEGLSAVRIPAGVSVADGLRDLPDTTNMRLVVLEGREALRDVAAAVLEDGVHAINAHIRGRGGTDLVVWPANTDDMAQKLAELASSIGGGALLGSGEPIRRFFGPPSGEFVKIAQQTVSVLNEGAMLAALGVSEDRANELTAQAPTIGAYLGLIRDELLKNEAHVQGLLANERFRMWTLVIAGDDAERDVSALTRGPHSVADIERLLTATEANVVKELRAQPAQLGILGSMLDARIMSLGTVEVLAIVREFGDDALHNMMRARGMTVKSEPGALERLAASEVGVIMSGRQTVSASRGNGSSPGSCSRWASRHRSRRRTAARRQVTSGVYVGCRRRRRELAARSPARTRCAPCSRRSGTASVAPKTVTCGGCGGSFELSARREYAWRMRGREPLCEACRRPPPAVTPEARAWWLEHLGAAEARALARLIWPRG